MRRACYAYGVAADASGNFFASKIVAALLLLMDNSGFFFHFRGMLVIMNQSFDGLSDKECLMYGIDDQSQLTCLYSMQR